MTQKHVELCHSQEQTGKKLGEQEKGRGRPVTPLRSRGLALVPRMNSQAHECPSAGREGFPLAWSPRESWPWNPPASNKLVMTSRLSTVFGVVPIRMEAQRGQRNLWNARRGVSLGSFPHTPSLAAEDPGRPRSNPIISFLLWPPSCPPLLLLFWEGSEVTAGDPWWWRLRDEISVPTLPSPL